MIFSGSKVTEIDAPMRISTRGKLASTIGEFGLYDDVLVQKKARDLECCILVFSKSDPFIYRKKLGQLYHNIQQNGEYLFKTYHVWDLAFLDNRALAHSTKEEEERLQTRKRIATFQSNLNDKVEFIQKRAKEDNLEAHASVRCRDCKSYDVFKIQKQIRSGDEAMTDFYECRECGKRWKKN